MKRTTKAFLLSFLLLASPTMAAKGGQGNRADRGQARVERQARQQHQAQRAARKTVAAERHQARAVRHQAATARHERKAVARVERADRRNDRAVIHQQRKAQQERAVRRDRAIDRVERRQAVRADRTVVRAQRQVAKDERRIVREQRKAVREADRFVAREQRQALRNDRIVAREQRQSLRAERVLVTREQRRNDFVAAQRFDRDQRRVFRAERLRVVSQPRPVWDGPRRFRGLDFNGDAMISRVEWRGNDRSFNNHDWNGDGILSGNEVVPGGRSTLRNRVARFERFPFVERFLPLPRRMVSPVPLMVAPVTTVDFVPLPPLATAFSVPFDEVRFERVVRVDGFAPVGVFVDRVQVAPVDRVLVTDRFLALDLDRDRFVSWNEWTGPRPLFRQLDVNDDRRLFADELVVSNPRVRTVTMVDRERYVAFALLDQDDDSVIAPWEWTGDMDTFFWLDVDGNGLVDQSEYLGLVRTRPVPVRMIANGALDFDHDGCVTRSEWVGDPYRFVSLDLNADGRVKPAEAVAGALLATQL